MTYDAQERSRFAGKPVEVYRFNHAGTFYLYTTADQPITLTTGTYVPLAMERGEISYSSEDDSGQLSVVIPRDDPLAALFIPYLPIVPVTLQMYRNHRGDAEELPAFTGVVMACSLDGNKATLVCGPGSRAMKRQLPRLTYQFQCNHTLYGAGCLVDRNLFRYSATVTLINGADYTIPGASLQPDQWYRNGYMERVNGDRRFIINHVGDLVTLSAPMHGMGVGEAVSIFAGCDRTEAVCTTKFNNLVRHLGFARVPRQNPFNTSIT